MPGINTTGKPTTKDYNLGRGIVYLATLNTDGSPKGWRDLGNATEFNLAVETETLEHQSSREGLKITDKEVVVSQKVTATFTLDELSFQNQAAFFSGNTAGYDNSAAVAGVAVGTDNLTVYAQAEWYDLYSDPAGKPANDPNSERIYDIGAVSIEPSGGGTPFILGTDYEVDQINGRVFVIAGGGMVGSVPGTLYDVDIAANPSADPTIDAVHALTTSSFDGALKFVAENPANADAQTEVQLHQVSLKSEGDFALIGDDWTTMGFTAVAERNEAADALSPTMTIRYPDQT